MVQSQVKLGQVNIAEIEFDLHSRDEMPWLLMGLQFTYCTRAVPSVVFRILKGLIGPGMPLWKILVLGTLRLGCNWDFGKIKEIVDRHDTVRQMLGHGIGDSE